MQEFFRPILFRFSSHRNFFCQSRGGEARQGALVAAATDDACVRQQQQQQRYPGSLAAPSDTRCWLGWRGGVGRLAHLSQGPLDAFSG